MAGVTPTGFVPKTLGDLKTDIGTGLRGVFGASINLDSRSRYGQLRDLIASSLSTLWELGETIAGAFDPAGASGVLLDNLCALTGTYRRQAFPSTVELLLAGVTGTVITTGSRVRVLNTTAIFETEAPATLLAVAAWVTLTPYVVGDLVTADSSVWRCIDAGTSGAVAPNGDGPFTDGGVIWQRLGDGDASTNVTTVATENGPLQGYAGTVTEIDTPIAGWNAATNLLDAVPGALREEDPALRVRRANEIAAIGTSPLPSLLAKLLRVDGVTTVTVFENTTDATVDSITPHAIEALLEGGDDAMIRQAIFTNKAGGIETCGNVSGSVNDSLGNPHTIKFSRPTDVDVYVKVEATVNPGAFPINGFDQIKAAIVNAGDLQALGRNVVASQISSWVFAVPGILDLVIKISTAPGPTVSTTIPISLRERAVYDTSRITVSSVPGVP